MNIRVHEVRQQITVHDNAPRHRDACLDKLPHAAKVRDTHYSERMGTTHVAYDIPASHVGCSVSLSGPGFDNQQVW